MSADILLLSRDCLLGLSEAQLERAARALARLNRHGAHLLITASQPEKWTPTRGSVDQALSSQTVLQQCIRDFGGELDGIYYVPRSLFTQDRNRRGALQDIMSRYGVDSSRVKLISNSRPFVQAAGKIGLSAHYVGNTDELFPMLESLTPSRNG